MFGKLMAIAIIMGGGTVCVHSAELNTQRLYQYFSSVTVSSNGVCVKFKDDGGRYLISEEGQPTRLSEKGEIVLVPFNRKIYFHQKDGGIIFIPLKGDLEGKGFSLEDRLDARSLGGEMIRKRAILVVTPTKTHDSAESSFEIIEDDISKAENMVVPGVVP